MCFLFFLCSQAGGDDSLSLTCCSYWLIGSAALKGVSFRLLLPDHCRACCVVVWIPFARKPFKFELWLSLCGTWLPLFLVFFNIFLFSLCCCSAQPCSPAHCPSPFPVGSSFVILLPFYPKTQKNPLCHWLVCVCLLGPGFFCLIVVCLLFTANSTSTIISLWK